MATINYEDGLMARLKKPAFASEYLNEALKDGSQEVFMLAPRDVARAKGITSTAKEAELNSESLYKMLSKAGNPNLSSLNRLLDTMGADRSAFPQKNLTHNPSLLQSASNFQSLLILRNPSLPFLDFKRHGGSGQRFWAFFPFGQGHGHNGKNNQNTSTHLKRTKLFTQKSNSDHKTGDEFERAEDGRTGGADLF